MKDYYEPQSVTAVGVGVAMAFLIMSRFIWAEPLFCYLAVLVTVLLAVALARMYTLVRTCQKETDELRIKLARLTNPKGNK
jgi:hypothetical protein